MYAKPKDAYRSSALGNSQRTSYRTSALGASALWSDSFCQHPHGIWGGFWHISMCVATVFLQPSSQASDPCFNTSDYIQNTVRPSVFLEISSSTGTIIPKIKCLETSYSLGPGDTHSTPCTSHGPNDSSSWWDMTDFFWIPHMRFNYHLTLLISTLKTQRVKEMAMELKD